jgi:predicted SAM-dependent methyltransferase
MLNNILIKIKSRGISNILSSFNQRIFHKKAICFNTCKELLSNKIGLEIGGPSSIFKKSGVLPIYSIAKRLDNCNFAGVTTWEGSISSGQNFYFDKNSLPGYQYLAEATNLHEIDSGTYDFILSSHMLEHTANPLKALLEWTRVLKEGGFLVIIVPHKDTTFDHNRSVTTLGHIVEDFENGIKEDDLTHLPEILEFHDLSKDIEAGTFELFKERSEKNFDNRCLHQHVFDTSLAVQILHHQHLQICAVEAILPCHIIVIAQKISDEKKLDNEKFLKNSPEYSSLSPFPSDNCSTN